MCYLLCWNSRLKLDDCVQVRTWRYFEEKTGVLTHWTLTAATTAPTWQREVWWRVAVSNVRFTAGSSVEMTANVHTFRTASDPPVRHLVLSSIQQTLGTPWGGGQTLPLVTGQTVCFGQITFAFCYQYHHSTHVLQLHSKWSRLHNNLHVIFPNGAFQVRLGLGVPATKGMKVDPWVPRR